MLNSKQIVKNTVDFKDFSVMPIIYFNRHIENSDFLTVGYDASAKFIPRQEGESEWGFVWQRHDNTMGQPKFPPLKDGYHLMDDYKIPNAHEPERYDRMKEQIRDNPDKYVMANLGISGFNILTFIRGFEESLEDLYIQPDLLMELMNKVVDFECGVIEEYLKIEGVDCIGFGDDWGTQNALMIDPKMFRKYFVPIYKRQFDLIKSHGKHIFFHTCGQVYDILEDLIDLGVDILNLNQPDIFPMEALEKFVGRVCFNCPVDHQTVAIHGSHDEIMDYTKKLVQFLAIDKGGFIANIEEYSSVGMSEENFLSICEGFEAIRHNPKEKCK